MRVTELSPDHVRRAARLFVEAAWGAADAGAEQRGEDLPAAVRATLARLDAAADLDELFAAFERRPEDQRGDLRRFTLRLGNRCYPFMKLVVQEYLVIGEMFFSVDTHDELDVRPTAPDYHRWIELKRFNRELKTEIERAWEQAGLPTHVDLRRLAEELAAREGPPEQSGRILVVDDEREVARSVQVLLSAEGYDVELAHTGERVLERLDEDPLPDLVMLDYEMPGLDGDECLRQIRSDPRTRKLPVLMATAADIELGRLPRVSGFLRKPYTRELLYRIVAQLIEETRPRSRARRPK